MYNILAMKKPCIILLSCSLWFSACGIPQRMAYDTTRHEGKLLLDVNLYPDANQNNPVALDLVLVNDKAVLTQLAAMPASQWFNNRTQVERDHPGETQLKSWEWVPGQDVNRISVPINPKVKGAIIFARYFSPGAHRAVIKTPGHLQIDFKDTDFTLQTKK
jgi:type VI secretion system protein